MQTKSFLDTLLNALEENPDQMTNKDIREEVDTFLFEGHDTSSIAITIALIFLGLNQDVQVRFCIVYVRYKS
jgi:cytochrome P450